MGTVGVVVNPVAGKDIRRLVSAAGHTSDHAKIGIVRRALIAAGEAGATRLLLAPDPHHLAERAVADLTLPVEVLDLALTGSRWDTVEAARCFQAEGVGCVIALGGDGTCRDVAVGWPGAPLLAISTGTNNVYPTALDATSAGLAAGFVAAGTVCLDDVGRRSKRIVVHGRGLDGAHPFDDVALVEVALVDSSFVGARAVRDPHTLRVVVAAIATPASTGLAAIAGRVWPRGRWEDGGVFVRLGPGGQPVRVPLAPGSFTTVEVLEAVGLDFGDPVAVTGPGVLAFDGERDRPIAAGEVVELRVEPGGPILVDVERTLVLAAERGRFIVNDVSEEPSGY